MSIRCLDLPFSVWAQLEEAESIRELRHSHGTWEILLVCVDEDGCVFEAFIVCESLKDLSCLSDSIAVSAVDYEDETLSVLEVVLPESPESILTADVPAAELEVLVSYSLSIESNRWNGVDCLVELEFVQDGRFASCVESKEEKLNWGLLVEASVDASKHVGECLSHFTYELFE